MRTWGGDGRGGRYKAVVLVAAAAVVVIGGVAAAVRLTANSHVTGTQSGSSSRVVSVTSSFRAVTSVTPPVAVSKCTSPAEFTYSGTLSATAPGTMKYEWVYSSGKPGPVQTVSFPGAGHKTVTGGTVRSRRAGGGWGEIKMISPVAQTSNKAAYKLLCGDRSVGGITATAAITPAARTVSCGTAPPAVTVTITGAIETSRAEKVTYYWAQSDGTDSAPVTLTFTRPGTQAVEPLTVTPPGAPGSGTAVLVVTSPVTTASSPATYTLTCTAPASQPTASQTAPPAPSGTVPATRSAPGGTSGTSPPMSIAVNAPATAPLGQPYSGTVTVTGGDGDYTWSAVSDLPQGLTATADGATLTISGTPTPADTVTDANPPRPGVFEVTATVFDSSTSASRGFPILVSAAS